MGDLALQQEERVETFEREESRFEQKWSKSFYESEPLFLFPMHCDENGVKTFEISSSAWQFGVQTPLMISSGLYVHHIMNRVKNPIKNIETLCHAFLYAVDCEMRDRCMINFTVPGNGTPPYKACAHIRGFRNQNIFIEWVPE